MCKSFFKMLNTARQQLTDSKHCDYYHNQMLGMFPPSSKLSAAQLLYTCHFKKQTQTVFLVVCNALRRPCPHINNCLKQKGIAVNVSLAVIDSCSASDIYKLLMKMPHHQDQIFLGAFDLIGGKKW